MLRSDITYKILCRFEMFFWKGSPEECWNWIGGLDGKGYATFSIMGKPVIASRIAYLIEYGDFDQNIKALHSCDNPLCVNPKHLFLGTQKKNVRDMYEKKRQSSHIGACGDTNVNGKIPDAHIPEIRELYQSGEYTQEQLAEVFGTTRSNIGYIIRDNSRRVK